MNGTRVQYCSVSHRWFLLWSSSFWHQRACEPTQRQKAQRLGSGPHPLQWCWWCLAPAFHISLLPEETLWVRCRWCPARRSGVFLCRLQGTSCLYKPLKRAHTIDILQIFMKCKNLHMETKICYWNTISHFETIIQAAEKTKVWSFFFGSLNNYLLLREKFHTNRILIWESNLMQGGGKKELDIRTFGVWVCLFVFLKNVFLTKDTR